jgi:hypothetical protein
LSVALAFATIRKTATKLTEVKIKTKGPGGVRKKSYRFLTCFKTPTDAGCELRGTAHWEGDTFVNDYEGEINGKRTKMQDLWTDITPNSHTPTAAYDTGDGVMKPYVVSHSTRE